MRNYKDEYKKFQSSPADIKKRTELNRINHKKNTYGNNDNLDVSHVNGGVKLEPESTNRGRKEKSRMKGSKRKLKNGGFPDSSDVGRTLQKKHLSKKATLQALESGQLGHPEFFETMKQDRKRLMDTPTKGKNLSKKASAKRTEQAKKKGEYGSYKDLENGGKIMANGGPVKYREQGEGMENIGQAHRDKLVAAYEGGLEQQPTLQGAGWMGTREEMDDLVMGIVGGGAAKAGKGIFKAIKNLIKKKPKKGYFSSGDPKFTRADAKKLDLKGQIKKLEAKEAAADWEAVKARMIKAGRKDAPATRKTTRPDVEEHMKWRKAQGLDKVMANGGEVDVNKKVREDYKVLSDDVMKNIGKRKMAGKKVYNPQTGEELKSMSEYIEFWDDQDRVKKSMMKDKRYIPKKAQGGKVKEYKEGNKVPNEKSHEKYTEEMKKVQDKYKQVGRWRDRIQHGAKEGIPKHKDFLPWLERQEAERDSLENVVIDKYYPKSKTDKTKKKQMGGEVKKLQDGGMLSGPSHKKGGIAANVGNQPIEMEGGEFVIKKESAKKLGEDLLHYMNKTGKVPKFLAGGYTNKLYQDGGMTPEKADEMGKLEGNRTGLTPVYEHGGCVTMSGEASAGDVAHTHTHSNYKAGE